MFPDIRVIYEIMDYNAEDLIEIWRKGDGEMPEKLKHIVNAASGTLQVIME